MRRGARGIGKSLVYVNLAVYFAQLGEVGRPRRRRYRRLQPASAAFRAPGRVLRARRRGGRSAGRPSCARADERSRIILFLVLPPTTRFLRCSPFAPVERCGGLPRWASLPAEYLVIDVGPGHGDLALDLMLLADVAVAVTVPEPPAIETTYRFLRAAFRRRLRRILVRDKLQSAILERAFVHLGELPAPIVLVRQLAKMDRSLAELAWAEAVAMRTQLVVNQTRVRTDMELGAWMSGVVSRHYGVLLDELGHIEHDDTVWLTVRRNKPLLVDSPTSKSARNMERIARRVLALATTKPAEDFERPRLSLGTYPLCGTRRRAFGDRRRDSPSVQAAARGLRERRSRDGVAPRHGGAGDSAAQARRGARATLLDVVRRGAYDLSTFPDPEPRGALCARRALRSPPVAGDAPGGAPGGISSRTRSLRAPSCAKCANRKGSSSPR